MVSEAHGREGIEAWNAIFVNGHPKGSLMVRMARTEDNQEGMEKKIDRMQETLDDLPSKLGKMVLLWLSIAVTLIGIMQFLGPSLRKTMGLAENPQPTLAESAHTPYAR